uniref:Uncharacterized protein n=3 Tax=Ciona intestinalis TaxID=7719 RepID=F6ZBZ1_CIOIN
MKALNPCRNVVCGVLICLHLVWAQTPESMQGFTRRNSPGNERPGARGAAREGAAMTPEVVGAFTSEHGETFRQFSSNEPTACQYVFSVDSAQCESNGMKTKIIELQSAFRTVQSQLNAQENRLHQAERFIREIQERLNINRPTEESRTEYVTTGPQKSGAGNALVSLSEIMQTELVNLEIQIDDAEKRRVDLERENSNLTSLLVQSRTSASEL